MARKTNKSIYIGKEEIKLYLSTDDIFIYTEKPKELTNKPLEIICELSKGTGYKVNRQKSTIFLCTSNEHLEY